MSNNYVVPQTKISQEYADYPTTLVQHFNPLLIGPAYTLLLYSEASMKENLRLWTSTADDATQVEYAGNSISGIPWNYGDPSFIDFSYCKLYFDDADLSYASNVSVSSITDNVIKTDTNLATAYAAFGGVKAGDKVTLTGTGIATAVEATVIGTAQVSDDPVVAVGGGIAWVVAALSDASSASKYSTGYRVQVTQDGLKVRILNTTTFSFRDLEATALNGSVSTTFQGITFTANLNGLTTDDYADVTITVTPGTVLNSVIVDVLPDLSGASVIKMQLTRNFSGLAISKSGKWSATQDGISIMSGISTVFPGTSQTVTVKRAGAVYMEYRYLNTGISGSILTISGEDIESVLGFVHPDNPVAFAAHIARKNMTSGAIYAIALDAAPEESTADNCWSRALTLASLNKDMYTIEVVSSLALPRELAHAHVLKYSDPSYAMERIAFTGENPAAAYAVVKSTDDTQVTVAIAAGSGVNTGFKVATFANANLLTAGVREGSKIRLNFVLDSDSTISYTEYPVLRVLTSTTARIGNAASTTSATPVEVWNTRTASEEVEEIIAESERLHSKRAYNVFGGTQVISSEGYSVDPVFLSIAVAALTCQCVPQQGLTDLELNGFSSLPDMYSRYGVDQLNSMAAAGTLLIMQASAGGPVFVRHQISTARPDGNLNTTELSLVKNLDSITFFFRDSLRDARKGKNITPDLLATLRLRMLDGLNYLISNTDTAGVGPQLLAENTALNSLSADPILKDTVNADLNLDMPKPFNTLNVVLRGV